MDGVPFHGTPDDTDTLAHQLHCGCVFSFVKSGQLGSVRLQHRAIGHFQDESLLDGDAKVAASLVVRVGTENAHNFPAGQRLDQTAKDEDTGERFHRLLLATGSRIGNSAYGKWRKPE